MALKLTSVSYVAFLSCLWILAPSADEVSITITAEPGETVTLPCEDSRERRFYAVKWIRPDLDPENIFFFPPVPDFFQIYGGHYHLDDPHVSFKNRVELKEREMWDGKMSLILRNVNFSDTGTYECHAYYQPRRPEFISIIHLDVRLPADLNLSVVRILLHLVVFCLFFISTLLMVSLYQCKPTGNNETVSMSMSLSNRGGEDLDEQDDYIMDDFTIEHRF
ncbi:uncharacterized protein LOC113168479 [Anabas testudineus]|uniref:uncharacterized protein LOC113168479 n=1 Tax=Anabas testudineus TaxID=64144 RepID=UPI000E464A38|nr:uncharacterized protein LOC113168479 [Anabas testudineus]